MPLESVIHIAEAAPDTLPAATVLGLLVIVVVSRLFTCAPVGVDGVHVAVVPQMVSATVLVLPPVQEFPVRWSPQSLSVTRIWAVEEIDMPHVVGVQAGPVPPVSAMSIWILSPVCRVLA